MLGENIENQINVKAKNENPKKTFFKTYNVLPTEAKTIPQLVAFAKATEKVFPTKEVLRNLNEGNSENVRNALEIGLFEISVAFANNELTENLSLKISQLEAKIIENEGNSRKVLELTETLKATITEAKTYVKTLNEQIKNAKI